MIDGVLGYLKDIGQQLLAVLLVLLGVAIALAITWYIARLARNLVRQAMTTRRLDRSGALLLSRLAFIGVWIIGIGVVLARLGVNTTGLIAFLSASTVAISLSLQDVLRNFVSGLFLLFERPFQVGDRIKVRDVVGEVQGIDLRTTLIRNTDGYLIMIPNSTIFTEIITNRSHYRTRRLKVTLTGSRDAMSGIEERLPDALARVPGVRRPFPSPDITTSSPDEVVLDLSLLIDSKANAEHDLMIRLAEEFPAVSAAVRNPE